MRPSMSMFMARSLWARVTDLAQTATSVRAAIAYAGRDAPRLLPLTTGDLVIVDGSTRALRAGSTHPDAIARWVRCGAVVYSLEGLHAKVILFDHAGAVSGVVGSANASTHSADHLFEAAVHTDDPAVTTALSEQIDLWAASADGPLDAAWVTQARTQYRPAPVRPPRRRVQAPFPGRHAPLWVGQYSPHDGSISAQACHAIETARLDYGGQALIDTWEMMRGDEARVQPGDGVVLLQVPASVADDRLDGRWTVSPPGVVLRVIDHPRRPPEAIIASDPALRRVRWTQIQRLYAAQHTRVDLDNPLQAGRLREAILDLWKPSR